MPDLSVAERRKATSKSVSVGGYNRSGRFSLLRVERKAMPIHDWTRVDAGLFHAFHQGWIITLSATR